MKFGVVEHSRLYGPRPHDQPTDDEAAARELSAAVQLSSL
jgi:hypothetical protein